MSISDLSELRRRAQAAARPGVARAESSNRRRWKKCAIERFERDIVAELDGSTREFASATLEVDESAIRRPEHSLPTAWWIEAMIERDPDRLLRWIDGIIGDIERLKKTGT